MPYAGNHGGGCCGILHLFDFDDYGPSNPETAAKNVKEVIEKKMIAYYEKSPLDGWNCLVEVVLLTPQLDNGWRSVLEGIGFKEINSFRNSNSGNTCHILHLQTKEMK